MSKCFPTVYAIGKENHKHFRPDSVPNPEIDHFLVLLLVCPNIAKIFSDKQLHSGRGYGGTSQSHAGQFRAEQMTSMCLY